jgi:hypothetical protein
VSKINNSYLSADLNLEGLNDNSIDLHGKISAYGQNKGKGKPKTTAQQNYDSINNSNILVDGDISFNVDNLD